MHVLMSEYFQYILSVLWLDQQFSESTIFWETLSQACDRAISFTQTRLYRIMCINSWHSLTKRN